MSNQSKGSPALIGTGMFFIMAGGLSYLTLSMMSKNYRGLAVPIAACSAFVGASSLILNAILHPESIRIPDVEVKIPTVKVEY